MRVYTLDCFTDKSFNTKFPENTYTCETVDEVSEVIRNCSRPIAGIVKVEVWISEYGSGEINEKDKG